MTIPTTNPLRVPLGVLSIWPVVYIGLFFTFMVAAMAGGGSEAMIDIFPVVMGVHAATAMLGMALVIGYGIHALTDRTLPTQERLLWGILLFVGNLLAVPAYWYLRIWRPSEAVTTEVDSD